MMRVPTRKYQFEIESKVKDLRSSVLMILVVFIGVSVAIGITIHFLLAQPTSKDSVFGLFFLILAYLVIAWGVFRLSTGRTYDKLNLFKHWWVILKRTTPLVLKADSPAEQSDAAKYLNDTYGSNVYFPRFGFTPSLNEFIVLFRNKDDLLTARLAL